VLEFSTTLIGLLAVAVQFYFYLILRGKTKMVSVWLQKKKVRSNEVLLLGTYFYSSCASEVIVHGEQEDQVLCLRQWVFWLTRENPLEFYSLSWLFKGKECPSRYACGPNVLTCLILSVFKTKHFQSNLQDVIKVKWLIL